MAQNKKHHAHQQPVGTLPVLKPVPTTPAEQLISDLAAAREGAAEGTLDNVWPSKIYRQDVTVIAPDKRSTMVNPKFCLTDAATEALMGALATRGLSSTVKEGGVPPNANGMQLGGSHSYSDSVNGIVVSFDGGDLTINAGVVYDYLAHGYPAAYALNGAEFEVRAGAFAAGVGPEVDVAAIYAQTAR
jgi:hypothetical protein